MAAAQAAERDSSEEASNQDEASNGLVLPAAADEEGDDSDDDSKPKKGGGNQGRRKIDIEFIEDKNKRHITFSKRKAGIMKKAYELSTLTGTQVLLLVVSETGLVYTYTTPKLSKLVMAREGKNLIQKCLTNQDGESPTKTDYPDPKLKHYAPRGHKSQPSGGSEMLSQPPLTSPIDAHFNMASTSAITAGMTASEVTHPIPLPPATTLPYSTAAYPSASVTLPTPMHHIPVTTLPMTSAGVSSAFDYPGSYASSTLSAGYQPVSAQSTANNVYSSIPLPPLPPPASAPMPSSPNKPTLKKRKTIENLKKNGSRSDVSTRLSEAQEQAARSLENARQLPSLENLFRAFTMQNESQRNNDPNGFDRGVSATITALHMAMNDNLMQANGAIPDMTMNSSVDRIDALYQYFFRVYLANKSDVNRKDLQDFAQDLIALAGWLLGHSFISHVAHIALVRHCASAKLSNNNKSGSQSPRKVPDARSRGQKARMMFIDYCTFAKNRYQKHWEPSMPQISGHFNVLRVSDTYLLLSEPGGFPDREFIDNNAPFKVRTPLCLNVLLRRGDLLQGTIQKAQGSSFWLPIALSDLSTVSDDSLIAEYNPQPNVHRFEMDQCQQMNDQVGFASAVLAYNKALRGENLIACGEFDDEGFMPRDYTP